MLLAIDEAQRSGGRQRQPLLPGAPHGAEIVLGTGEPELRHRIVMQHEGVRLVGLISPCAPLELIVEQPQCIVDILDEPTIVDPNLFVPGRLVLRRVPAEYSRDAPTVSPLISNTAGLALGRFK